MGESPILGVRLHPVKDKDLCDAIAVMVVLKHARDKTEAAKVLMRRGLDQQDNGLDWNKISKLKAPAAKEHKKIPPVIKTGDKVINNILAEDFS